VKGHEGQGMRRRTVDPSRVDLAALIERGTELHGHLGPYLVAGIRMGLLALDLLESPGYFGIEAESETGTVPPISCLTDGIQIGSGCTTGKGNLRVVAGGRARARFVTTDGRTATITLRPEAEEAFRSGDERSASERVSLAPIAELFTCGVDLSLGRSAVEEEGLPREGFSDGRRSPARLPHAPPL